jgi:hypothetical protein
MIRWRIALCAGALLVSCSAGTVRSGAARGRVYRGDEAYALSHAYAYAPAGGEELWVYVTDQPLPRSAIVDRFAAHELARAGKVHGIKLLLDPRNAAPTEITAVMLLPAAPNATMASVSISSSAGVFKELELGSRISGRIEQEQEAIFDSPPYGFAADFSFPAEESAPAVNSDAAQ